MDIFLSAIFKVAHCVLFGILGDFVMFFSSLRVKSADFVSDDGIKNDC